MALRSSSRTPLSPVKVQSRDENNNNAVMSPTKRNGSVPSEDAVLGGKKPRRVRDCENVAPCTPRGKKSITPRTPMSMGKRRILSSVSSPKSRSPAPKKSLAYSDVKASLTASLPDRLLCREAEISRIRDFLEEHVTEKRGGSLYVSGAPGTGKTAVLTTILREYEASEHRLQTAFVNCMTLKSSTAVYQPILTALSSTGRPSTSRRPQQQILKQISKHGNMVVVVLDEIDQIDSKHEEILYEMFEWPALENSRLILIGIANALDLTDRILPRLQANPACQPELLHFPPYTRDQVVTILSDRLGQSDLLEKSAVSFCAGKVASLAGDMRKALDLCRRAVDRAEQENCEETPKKVGIGQVVKAANDADTASSQEGMPLQQKIAVCAHLLLTKRDKLKEIPAGKLHQTYTSICRQRQVQSASQAEFMSMCEMIEAVGVFSIRKTKEVRMSKIKLNLNEDELRRTLQDDTLITSILNQKS